MYTIGTTAARPFWAGVHPDKLPESCASAPAPDYVTVTNRVITFPAGSTLQTTPVLVCNQLAYDGNETVNMIIGSPTNAQLNFQKNTSALSIVETNAKAAVSVSGAS